LQSLEGIKFFVAVVFSYLKTAIYIREFVILIVTKYILKVVIFTSQKNDGIIEVGKGNTLKDHSVLQQKTGILKLDEILNDGLPKYSVTLLAGMSGTGKTVLSFQWLFEVEKDGIKIGHVFEKYAWM